MSKATDKRHSKSLDDWYREAAMTIQWNESAAIAARRLRHDTVASLTVMDDDRAIGQIGLADIERCESNGNWLGAVLVHHLMRSPHDSHH
jgi:predicted transcriptional regulator